jgi:2,4-dienoyl-CoA reductase-like NADH-dependent reductase (Old Yellow Enzyme family)
MKYFKQAFDYNKMDICPGNLRSLAVTSYYTTPIQPLERADGTAEGKPSESAYIWYRKLAAGHWGVLFVENTTCSNDPTERGHSPNGFMITESNLPEFRRLVREIKEVSPDTVLMIQLSTGSPGNDQEGNKNFMSLPASAISRLLANMIRGAILAAEAGFNGMDLKLCHGHLTYQLSCEANKRHQARLLNCGVVYDTIYLKNER